MDRRLPVALVLVALVAAAGCAEPAGRPDPDTDRIGWEDGYWYDDPVPVDDDGDLDRRELRAVVDRATARVERIRGAEFERDVSVEVIDRETLRDRAPLSVGTDPFEDQVYEALFLVGEDERAGEALTALYGGSVVGYYVGDRIVVVAEDGQSRVASGTLAHELTHALQDQRGRLGVLGADSLDARLARQGLTEGEANYVRDRYAERCRGEWDCLSSPAPASERSTDPGLLTALYVPYSDGPTLVEALRERGNWSAVDAAYDRPPASTEQVIHPGRYPDERPRAVSIPDRSSAAWRPFAADGSGRTPAGRTSERLGEAALFTALLDAGVIPEDHLTTDDRRYNYSHPATDGWAGDTLRPYRAGERFGYVLSTAWDTDRDARQFRRAYRDLLERRGASRVRAGVYRIPDGPFADAFRLTRRGDRVVVVNAPTVATLDDVHAPR